MGKWSKNFKEKWERDQVYVYQKNSHKEDFVIDTPPPTVSGSLHIGHIFSLYSNRIL